MPGVCHLQGGCGGSMAVLEKTKALSFSPPSSFPLETYQTLFGVKVLQRVAEKAVCVEPWFMMRVRSLNFKTKVENLIPLTSLRKFVSLSVNGKYKLKTFRFSIWPVVTRVQNTATDRGKSTPSF